MVGGQQIKIMIIFAFAGQFPKKGIAKKGIFMYNVARELIETQQNTDFPR